MAMNSRADGDVHGVPDWHPSATAGGQAKACPTKAGDRRRVCFSLPQRSSQWRFAGRLKGGCSHDWLPHIQELRTWR
jgi:hypothetical protein